MNAQIPKIKFGDFKDFITSKEMIVVGSAILVTPLLQGSLDALILKIPFLKDHLTIAFVIGAFVIFIFASKVKGMFQPVLIGVAGGLLITAIAPFFEDAFGIVKRAKS